MRFLSKVVTYAEIASMDMGFGQAFIADKEGVELITATARNLHLAKSTSDGPIESPLVGIDVIMRIQQFNIEDTPVKATHFHKNIHTWGSSKIHEEIDWNQD